jgi:hypothetical protein
MAMAELTTRRTGRLSGLDVRQRSTAGDQPRDMGVPQIMKPERREPSAFTPAISLRHTCV